jgi:DNA end-binding protein Ku
MPRAIWKGAIAFGLVHVPVALYPATQDNEIDFDWLDRRTMDPVGYKRVNKRTGREVAKDDIVKGVRHGDGGRYVVLADDEIRAAYPRTTQTIEIASFVPAHEVPFVYLERPYYLEPTGRADKPYALLREALARESLIGIARLVMHAKEHLAALLPAGPALMLGTLRWTAEVRSAEGLNLPPAGSRSLAADELRMAGELIRRMTTRFEPQRFEDRFSDAIRTLVERKAKAGQTKTVEPLEAPPEHGGAEVIDLTELLRRSLAPRPGARRSRDAQPKRARKRA